jgi:hypothetical protein
MSGRQQVRHSPNALQHTDTCNALHMLACCDTLKLACFRLADVKFDRRRSCEQQHAHSFMRGSVVSGLHCIQERILTIPLCSLEPYLAVELFANGLGGAVLQRRADAKLSTRRLLELVQRCQAGAGGQQRGADHSCGGRGLDQDRRSACGVS